MSDPAEHVHILVVDDYEPFRHYICETLQAKPEWRVIAEASDGLQAVHKAEELKPSLVVLDIGLPTAKWRSSSSAGSGVRYFLLDTADIVREAIFNSYPFRILLIRDTSRSVGQNGLLRTHYTSGGKLT